MDVPRAHRNPVLAAAVTIAALLVGSAPAHAVGANVPLPQTPLPLPQTEVTVTVPGAGVNVGPGGASVNVDPGKAIGGVTNPPPSSGTPSAGTPSAGKSANPSASSPSAPSSAPRGGDSKAAPVRGGVVPRTASKRRAGGQTSAGSTRSAQASQSPAAAGVGTREVAARRRAATEDSSKPGVVTRIVEKIPRELLAALLVMALFGAGMSLVWLRERRRVRAARRRAEVDALTGIFNRLGFDQRLSDEWKRSRRYGRRLGLLLLDIDGLKRVNDTKGHEAGDRMIRAAAEHISEDIRQSDLAARLAGDEFVVLCPETDRHGLEQLGAKLTERLARGGIAASIGWAELGDRDVQPADLLARADAAMYEEKARRRGNGRAATARPGFAIAS